ncbi:MAG: hypothetical protein U1C51_07330 [Candidatus Izemoplasmatales bacterium]|nr:hypothetical protein [Candidatus Izemoplasmatales bacterium]
MKKSFEDYIQETAGRPLEILHLSESLLSYLKQAYRMGVGLKAFFDGVYGQGDETGIRYLNKQLRLAHKIQFHGIGKNPYQRYYAYEDHYSWLKLEHFLISHFYSIKKDESFISNRTIAIKLGWLSENETNPKMIERAERKVQENLYKLKSDRMTITVEQRYNPGKLGSFHIIRANWFAIIPLYSEFRFKEGQSIRMRKSIRYRIISLINAAATSFSEGLKKLFDLQRNKYLKGLITLDYAEFKNVKDIWKDFIDEYRLNDWLKLPEYIIPEWVIPNLVLHVKNKVALSLLKEYDAVAKFKEYCKRDLIIRTV